MQRCGGEVVQKSVARLVLVGVAMSRHWDWACCGAFMDSGDYSCVTGAYSGWELSAVALVPWLQTLDGV